jgi:hypothetical protein
MPRRLLALLAVIGVFAVVACQGAPAVPSLSDPKDILARTVLSLKDIKTITVHGDLTGTATIPGSGTIDLKGTTLDAAYDIAGKKGRFAVSAPSLLGTTAEVLYLDNAAYYKITGPLASSLGADPTGKYKKTAVTPAGPDPNAVAADPNAAIDKVKAALDKLPTPPTKAANEKCGDKDCYHIVLTLTDKDIATLSPSATPTATPTATTTATATTRAATTPFTLTVDIWSQTDNLRPVKLAFALDAGTTGKGTLTFTMTYDQAVDVAAPPADQIAP